jgi:hypothetical protein
VEAVAAGRAKRARSTSRAVARTAAPMARALTVAPATKSGGSALASPRSGLPASRARKVSSKRLRRGESKIWGSLWNTTLAPVMRPSRSTPPITSNGVVE